MKYLLLILPIIFLLNGCATVVSWPTQKLTVHAQPEDSVVKIDGMGCENPCTRRLMRWPAHTITAEKEGCKPCRFETNKYMNPWVLGNILIGGLIGVAIDLASGSAVMIGQKEVTMILSPTDECEVFIRPALGEEQWQWVSYAEPKREEKKPEP